MKLAHKFGDVAMLTNKEITRIDGPLVSFSDGSNANLNTRSCMNCGLGDIRFLLLPEYDLAPGATETIVECQAAEQIFIEGADTYFDVYPSENAVARAVLAGTPKFHNHSRVQNVGNSIMIETIGERGGTTTFLKGRRIGPPVEGHVKLYLPKCVALAVKCLGAGIGRVSIPIAKLDVEIHGSLSLNCLDVSQANISIHGSGQVRLAQVREECKVGIAGSGDVNISSGEFSHLDAYVTGSGSIIAAVSVNHATLKQTGSGCIFVAHVIEDSSEVHGGSGVVRVLKRGP